MGTGDLLSKLFGYCAELHSITLTEAVAKRAVVMVSDLAGVPYAELWLKDEEAGKARLAAVNDEALLSDNFPRALPLDKSVIGEVISTGTIRLFPDLREAISWRREAWIEEKGLTRYIGVPLFFEEQAVGAFSILAESHRELGETELQILQFLAAQVSIALLRRRTEEKLKRRGVNLEEIVEERTDELEQSVKKLKHEIIERKRVEEELRSYQRRLEAVGHIGALANATLELDEVLHRILEGTLEATGASVGMIFLRDIETGCLTWGESIGLSDAFVAEYIDHLIEPGEGLTGRIAETGEPIYIPWDSSHDPRITRPVVVDEGLNSFIGVPIHAEGEIIGVMNILTKPPDILSEKEIALVAAVGTHVGSAIRNARLFEERKQAEEKLREWASFAELNPAPVLRFDPNGNITHANPVAYKVFGKDKLEGKPIGGILPCMACIDLEEFIREGRTDTCPNVEVGEKDFQFVCCGVPSLGVGHIYGSEVTERKRAEEKLSVLKALNENVVRSMQNGLVAVDRDLRVTLWNRAMEEISGYTADEVSGRAVYDVLPHLVEQGVDKLYKAALKGETAERLNVAYQTPKGKTGYTNERFAPLKDHVGEVIGVLAVVEDVTELLRLEKHVANLQEEVRERKLIDIAKDILVRERGMSIAESHKFIINKSRDERVKAVEIARQLITLLGTPEERKKFTQHNFR